MDNKIKLNFIKRILTDTVSDESIRTSFFDNNIFPSEEIINQILNSPVEPKRLSGMDWPERAHTMVGLKRLDNLHECLDYVRENNIEGDFIETGVWRGGASIFIQCYNKCYNMDRKVFVADSFEGLPIPNTEKYPADSGDIHHTIDFLKITLETVQENFKLYNALDNNVIFLKGWFSDTLKDNNQINKISLLRFDGDMYGSTIDVLDNIYHKVKENGVIIVDDYCLPNCVKAIGDFREKHHIIDEIKTVDACGVYWYKSTGL